MIPCAKNPEILEMRVEIDFKDGSWFSYNVSEELYPIHDTRERTWRHLNFFQYRCYKHTRVPRIILHDGKVKTVDVPRGRDLSIFILMN